jgi:hypothetical protein
VTPTSQDIYFDFASPFSISVIIKQKNTRTTTNYYYCFTKHRTCAEICDYVRVAIWRVARQVSYYQQQIRCLTLETILLTDGVQFLRYCDTVNKHITVL